MKMRYVITSNCLLTGSISLTHSLKTILGGRNTIQVKGEDGVQFECLTNPSQARLEGFGPYFTAQGLGVNSCLNFELIDESLVVSAKSTAGSSGSVRTKNEPRVEATPKQNPRPVGPEVTLPPISNFLRENANSAPNIAVPAFARELETLGFTRESGSAPWVFKASLGRKTFSVAFARFGEVSVKELSALITSGQVHYAGIVSSETNQTEVQHEIESTQNQEGPISFVTTEALTQLCTLSKAFPVGAVEFEKLLRTGTVSSKSLSTLHQDVSAVLGERAAFSSVLALLNDIPPQQIFMVGDLMHLARDLRLEADHVQTSLDTLCKAPFLLLKRISAGEFQMRQSVSAALYEWRDYASIMERRVDELKIF